MYSYETNKTRVLRLVYTKTQVLVVSMRTIAFVKVRNSLLLLVHFTASHKVKHIFSF